MAESETLDCGTWRTLNLCWLWFNPLKKGTVVGGGGVCASPLQTTVGCWPVLLAGTGGTGLFVAPPTACWELSLGLVGGRGLGFLLAPILSASAAGVSGCLTSDWKPGEGEGRGYLPPACAWEDGVEEMTGCLPLLLCAGLLSSEDSTWLDEVILVWVNGWIFLLVGLALTPSVGVSCPPPRLWGTGGGLSDSESLVLVRLLKTARLWFRRGGRGGRFLFRSCAMGVGSGIFLPPRIGIMGLRLLGSLSGEGWLRGTNEGKDAVTWTEEERCLLSRGGSMGGGVLEGHSSASSSGC